MSFRVFDGTTLRDVLNSFKPPVIAPLPTAPARTVEAAFVYDAANPQLVADITGNGNNFTFGSAAPTWVADGVRGAVDGYLNGPSSVFNQNDFSYLLVMKAHSKQNAVLFGLSDRFNSQFTPDLLKMNYRRADGTWTDYYGPAYTPNEYFVYSVRFGGGDITFGVNKDLSTIAESQQRELGGGTTRLLSHSDGSQRADATVAYLYAFDYRLTDAEFNAAYNRIGAQVGRDKNIVIPGLPYTPPVMASAETLRKSIGVNIHSSDSNSSYYDGARILAKVQELGITRVRDGFNKNVSTAVLANLRTMVSAGIRVVIIAGKPVGTSADYVTGDSAAFVTKLKDTSATGYAGTFTELEGPNEWNISGDRGANWQQELKDFYAAYQNALNADPALADVPFWGPSLVGPGNYQTYVDPNQENYNLHSYRGGQMPERTGTGEAIDTAKAYAVASAGNKPFVATETGYHNAVNSIGHAGVSEAVYAHYIVREAFWNLSQSLFASFIYQLIDQKPDNPAKDNPEGWFGLYAVEGDPLAAKGTWTLRRKLPGDAIVRLTAALADSGTGTAQSTLPFTVANAPAQAKIYGVARKDGTYQIGVVLANSLWDTNAKAAIADTTGNVTLTFASPVTVTAQRPSVDDVVTTLGTAVTSLTVVADGKMTLLKIS